MATYRIDDVVLSTEKAVRSWEEDTRWDGSNHISKATGSQWDHETLYQSSKGNYWIEWTSQWEGKLPSARWMTPEEAACWILAQEGELPEELRQYEEQVSE